MVFSLISASVIQYFAEGETPAAPVINTTPDVTDTDIVEFGDGKTVSEDIQGESFTILSLIQNPETERITGATFVKADKDMKNYWFMSVPVNMLVPIDGVDTPISDIPLYHDRAFFIEKLYAVTGIRADYTFLFSDSGLSELIDALGGIEYEVPEDLLEYATTDSTIAAINIKKGMQTLDGRKAVQMLKYSSYSNGSEGVCAAHRGIAKAICGIVSSPDKAGWVSENINLLLSYADTDFTAEVYENNIQIISAYSSFIKTESQYPGYDSEEDGVKGFIPYVDEATSKFRQYR